MTNTMEIIYTLLFLSLFANIIALLYHAVYKHKIMPAVRYVEELTSNTIRFLDILSGYKLAGSKYIEIGKVFQFYDIASGYKYSQCTEESETEDDFPSSSGKTLKEE